MLKTKSSPCRVDGEFIVPCYTLAHAVGDGIRIEHRVNMETRTPSRSFAVIKSAAFGKGGIVANFCPFCGTRIDAPVANDAEAAE